MVDGRNIVYRERDRRMFLKTAATILWVFLLSLPFMFYVGLQVHRVQLQYKLAELTKERKHIDIKRAQLNTILSEMTDLRKVDEKAKSELMMEDETEVTFITVNSESDGEIKKLEVAYGGR